MKKLIMAACAILLTPTVLAADSYTAKQSDTNPQVFCAKVEIQPVGVGRITRTRCRTLEQWEKAGYVVTQPQTEAQEANEQPTA